MIVARQPLPSVQPPFLVRAPGPSLLGSYAQRRSHTIPCHRSLPTTEYHRFSSLFVSYTYKSLFPQTLYLHIYTKPRGCAPLCVLCAYPQQAGSDLSALCYAFFRQLVLALDASHSVSHCCQLFVAAKTLNSFALSQIRTLATKHPGWACTHTPALAINHSPVCDSSYTRAHSDFRFSIFVFRSSWSASHYPLFTPHYPLSSLIQPSASSKPIQEYQCG